MHQGAGQIEYKSFWNIKSVAQVGNVWQQLVYARLSHELELCLHHTS